MNINQSNLNHTTLQFNLFDIASDVKSLEIRERDAYISECLSNKIVNKIFSHGCRSAGRNMISLYMLYQLPNCDYVYVLFTCGNYDIYIGGEEYYDIIDYIPYDNPAQLEIVLNKISHSIIQETQPKKDNAEIKRLNCSIDALTENNNMLKLEIQTLEATIRKTILENFDLKQTIKDLKHTNTWLKEAIELRDYVIDELKRASTSKLKTWLSSFKKSIIKFIK